MFVSCIFCSSDKHFQPNHAMPHFTIREHSVRLENVFSVMSVKFFYLLIYFLPSTTVMPEEEEVTRRPAAS